MRRAGCEGVGPMARAKKTSKPRKEKGASALFSEPAAIMAPRLLFILSVVALCIFGLVMVYSASSIVAHSEYGDPAYFFKRQVVFMLIGIFLCVVFARLPYGIWGMPGVFITCWCVTVILLSLTAFGMGISALGAERSIVIAGFALQPAEFAKIAVLITAASLIQMRSEGRIEGWNFIIVIIFATIIPLYLIYRQPDLGTAIILVVGILALSLLAGISWKIVVVIVGLLVGYIVIACITQPYHLQRIVSMFDPWLDPQGDGYQSIQSLYAFGSGGIFGTGLGLSRQKYLYLPYAHTDFIFAIVGEELGLFGTVLVVALFALFIFTGMRICRMAPDMFGCMLAGSFTVMIGFQACVNMACVTGIAPVTGKALPLISYGGSSMIATMIMIGIVLSVSFRSKVGMSYERKRDNFLVIEGNGGRRERPARPADDQDAPRGNVIGFSSARKARRAQRVERDEVERETSGSRSDPSGWRRRGKAASNAPREPFPWESPDDEEGIDYRSARGDQPKGYASLDAKRDPWRSR